MLAIGPVPMMRAVSELTRPHAVRTVVSLNSIMVDGTGMCGGCRVLVGGGSRFACVDGPEFDAHEVDFDVLAQRNAFYREAERLSLEEFERRHGGPAGGRPPLLRPRGGPPRGRRDRGRPCDEPPEAEGADAAPAADDAGAGGREA